MKAECPGLNPYRMVHSLETSGQLPSPGGGVCV